MSAAGHVRVIQQLLDAFGRGDVESILAALTGDVDWQGPVSDHAGSLPWAGRRRGRERVAGYFRQLAATSRWHPREDVVAAAGGAWWLSAATATRRGRPGGPMSTSGCWCSRSATISLSGSRLQPRADRPRSHWREVGAVGELSTDTPPNRSRRHAGMPVEFAVHRRNCPGAVRSCIPPLGAFCAGHPRRALTCSARTTGWPHSTIRYST
jgi:ketosteroid isomerase-like protein